MPIIDKFRYRPEIDGLRAIAVLAVVLFHAGLGCTGGYVGVDVFFVISGFLITSLIWKDLESGRFTFSNFWERRARRILPALVVVTIAVLAAGGFLLLPEDFRSMGRATVAQSLFAANVHYWQTSGYFDGASDDKPLLHTWSLAVEEQFYFIVPFMLWGIFRVTILRSRPGVVSLLAAVFLVSLALSIFGVAARQTSAFFLLPGRAWELLLGSLVAFMPLSPVLLGRRSTREILSLVGLALILIPVCFYTPETPFPGIAAIPPCLGAALLIWANGLESTSVSSLLSARPVVFIGLISYSLYLWHWPLLAFANYLSLGEASLALRTAMMGLGIIFAILSWKYVETPFRKRQIGNSRRSLFLFTGVGLFAVFACGLICWAMKGFPQRYSEQTLKFAAAKADMAFINEHTVEDVRSGGVPIGVAGSSLRPTVLVWGDSHAMAALPAIDAFLKEQAISGRAVTHSATAPVLDWFTISKFGLREEAIPFNESVFSYIKSQRIPHVILSAYWSFYVETDKGKPGSFDAALLRTVRQLVAINCRPWILLDVPRQPYHVPKALSLPIYSHSYIMSLRTRPALQNRFDRIAPETIAAIKASGGRIIDPKPKFLDSTGQHYIIHVDDVALYRDDQHLTTQGAKLILLPLLRESLTRELLTRGLSTREKS